MSEYLLYYFVLYLRYSSIQKPFVVLPYWLPLVTDCADLNLDHAGWLTSTIALRSVSRKETQTSVRV